LTNPLKTAELARSLCHSWASGSSQLHQGSMWLELFQRTSESAKKSTSARQTYHASVNLPLVATGRICENFFHRDSDWRPSTTQHSS